MQTESTRRLTCTVQTRYDLVLNVHDLALPIDLETGQRVVKYRRRPCRIERWFLNLIHGGRFAELRVLSHIDIGVVFACRFFQCPGRDRLILVRIQNFSG